jgi:hypothetical protein
MRSTIHFEQVRVETVKKVLAQEDLRSKNSEPTQHVIGHPHTRNPPATKDNVSFLKALTMEIPRGESPKHLEYPEWQKPYCDALVELDPAKLPRLVATAYAAVVQRLEIVASKPEHQAERQAIDDALASLRVLKKKELDFPDRQ